jgi:DNA-binding NarL/FixJ family response regulator
MATELAKRNQGPQVESGTQQDKIVALAAQGLKKRQIADQLGCRYQVVWQALKKAA